MITEGSEVEYIANTLFPGPTYRDVVVEKSGLHFFAVKWERSHAVLWFARCELREVSPLELLAEVAE